MANDISKTAGHKVARVKRCALKFKVDLCTDPLLQVLAANKMMLRMQRAEGKMTLFLDRHFVVSCGVEPREGYSTSHCKHKTAFSL